MSHFAVTLERTYVEIRKVADLLREGSDLLDWSVLGMILATLCKEH